MNGVVGAEGDRADVCSLVDALGDMQDLYIEPKGAVFYYDETENIGALYLRDGDFNDGHGKCFVLGGVYCTEDFQGAPLKTVKDQIRLQRNELKFSSLCKSGSDFCTCLTGGKLNRLLHWMSDTNLSVHYTAVDYLYFAVTDIVDSVDSELVHAFNFQLKSQLYELFKGSYMELYSHLYKYNYPNIEKKDIDPFCAYFIERIDACGKDGFDVLKAMFEIGRKQDELLFLKGNPDRSILPDLSIFYMMRIAMLKNSRHVFDEVDVVRAGIDKRLQFLTGCGDYRFVKSDDEDLIQISDCVVGLIGRYFEYLSTTDLESIKKTISNFNVTQRDNWRLFTNYMRAADILGYATSMKNVDPRVVDITNTLCH